MVFPFELYTFPVYKDNSATNPLLTRPVSKPEGTDVAGAPGNLFHNLNDLSAISNWQNEIPRAAQNWPNVANVQLRRRRR